MTLDLDRLQRRAIAFAIALLVPALITRVLLAPVVSYFQSARADREQSQHQLQKLQSLVNSAPALQKALAEIDGHALWQHVYNGPDSAAVQQDFRQLVEDQKITLDSVQPMDVVSERGFERLGVKVSFNTTIDRLTHLLLAMRAAPRILRFENLYVTTSISQPGGENPVLTVRGDVIAFGKPVASP